MGFAVSGTFSSLKLEYETWPFPLAPPIFHILSVSHRCTLTPASLTTEVIEIGVNFNFIFLKCDVFTDWEGPDQALLWGKNNPNYGSVNN